MEINTISYVKNLSSQKSPKIFDMEVVKIDTLENQVVTKFVSKCQKRGFQFLTRLTH